MANISENGTHVEQVPEVITGFFVANEALDTAAFTAEVHWLPVTNELAGLIKNDGTVTKHIQLSPEGKVTNDSAACWIATGSAHRTRYDDWRTFATTLENMPPNGAITLGTLCPERPEDSAYLVTKDNPCHKKPGRVARTKEFFQYRPVPTLAHLDHDTKHFSIAVKERVEALGGFTGAIESVCPALAAAGTILRASTSSGISNAETGEEYPSSGGFHLYVLVDDGTDIPRFLKVLQDRCWLAGLAGYWINKAGSLNEYSIIDTAVAGPERIVFEADPQVDPPLVQAKRAVHLRDGRPLVIRAACPDLSATELDKTAKLKSAARRKLKPEADAARETFITTKAEEATARGIDPIAAREMAEQWINGNILYPGVLIDFVAANLGLVDVAEILADPERFDGETCFDPIEGRDYGHATGKFYADSMGLHSFAHGLGQTFKLRHEPQQAQPANRNRAPILCAPGRLNEMTNEAEQALGGLGTVYQRLGKIVGVGQEKGKTCDGKSVTFQAIMERGNYALMRDLARATDFERFNREELVPCNPPMTIVRMLKEEGRSRLPILRGIISAPTLRADGSILQDTGFDVLTGLLYDPEGVEFPQLPDYPTKEEGRAALDKILHVFRGFPFEGKPGRESPSRSVAVACTLTALVRQSLVRAPGFAFDAPVPRTGKSKCIDIAHAIAWGHHAAVNNWTGDRKEDEKLLGAVALSGCAALAIDNIEDVIGGALLCEILTQPSVKVRILGLSQQPTAETAFLVTFNGNNLIFKGDITVRVLKARLDAGMEAPEERVFDFDPVDDALKNRAELVVAGLAAMRAFRVSPEQVECKPYSDFTGWSRMVREALIFYGEPDPVDTAKEVKTEDPRREEHRTILLEWKRAFGNFSYPAKDVAAAASKMSQPDSTKRAHLALFMALLGIAPAAKASTARNSVLGLGTKRTFRSAAWSSAGATAGTMPNGMSKVNFQTWFREIGRILKRRA